MSSTFKSSFAAVPLSRITDASLPTLSLVSATGTNTGASSSHTSKKQQHNSSASFVPDFIWNFADIPLSQVEDIGVPRIYFCEPAAVVLPSSSSSPTKPAFIMITYNQIVVVENSSANSQQRLAAAIEFSDAKQTRVQRVIKDDGRDTSFALISHNATNKILVAFLDVISRNLFVQTCDAVARIYGNVRCCPANSTVTPEDALDAVFVMNQIENHNNNNNNKNTNTTNSWRVPVLPFAGLIMEEPPVDPAEMLHGSLKTLIDRRGKRSNEDDLDHHNHILNRDALQLIQAPFRTLAASYDEQVSALKRELDDMRQADERKLKGAEVTMSRSLHSLDERKNLVRQNAAQAGEQLAEWLSLLQAKQTNELDATVTLSQKKQEYAKALDDADAQLSELYNEKRWIEAETSKFSTHEYVQAIARRDQLHGALDTANRAVAAELNEPGSSTILEEHETARNQQQNLRSVSVNSSTITSEASSRHVSLFSPSRVFKLYAAGSPTRNQNSSNNTTQNNSSKKSRFTSTSTSNSNNNNSNANKDNSNSTSVMTPRLMSTPKPRQEGLNKPIKIEQSVQQTLHVNTSLRKLLEAERNGAQEDKDKFAELSRQVQAAEATLQEILNDQVALACDIQKVEGENGLMRARREELDGEEQALIRQLGESSQLRTGLLLAAEMERDEALEQRIRAESVMRARKKENQNELFERTHDMLRANLRSLSVDD